MKAIEVMHARHLPRPDAGFLLRQAAVGVAVGAGYSVGKEYLYQRRQILPFKEHDSEGGFRANLKKECEIFHETHKQSLVIAAVRGVMQGRIDHTKRVSQEPDKGKSDFTKGQEVGLVYDHKFDQFYYIGFL